MWRKDGYLIILIAMTVISLVLQFVLQLPEDGARATFASVFENWQSEFIQLMVQFALNGLLADQISKRLQRKEKDQIVEAVREALRDGQAA